MMNTQEKGRCSPKSRVSERLPKVRIGVLLTAVRINLSGEGRESERERGMTLTSEPVSIKK